MKSFYIFIILFVKNTIFRTYLRHYTGSCAKLRSLFYAEKILTIHCSSVSRGEIVCFVVLLHQWIGERVRRRNRAFFFNIWPPINHTCPTEKKAYRHMHRYVNCRKLSCCNDHPVDFRNKAWNDEDKFSNATVGYQIFWKSRCFCCCRYQSRAVFSLAMQVCFKFSTKFVANS